MTKFNEGSSTKRVYAVALVLQITLGLVIFVPVGLGHWQAPVCISVLVVEVDYINRTNHVVMCTVTPQISLDTNYNYAQLFVNFRKFHASLQSML